MTILLTALADQIFCGTNLPVLIILLLNVDYLSSIPFLAYHEVNAPLEPLMTILTHETFQNFYMVWSISANSCLKLE